MRRAIERWEWRGMFGLIACFLFVGCGKEEEKPAKVVGPPPPPTMQFEIDPKLLGERQAWAEYGVSLQPPAGWIALPADQVTQFKWNTFYITTQPSSRPVEAANPATPLAIFRHPTEASMLVVSSLSLEGSDSTKYIEALREEFGDVKEATFRINEITVTQYLLRPKKTVDFRLIMAPPGEEWGRVTKYLRLDYVVPQERWMAQLRAVESSMGSLRKLK